MDVSVNTVSFEPNRKAIASPTSAMSSKGSAGSFAFDFSATDNSSACGLKRIRRIAKRRYGSGTSSPLHTSVATGAAPESGEQAPAYNSFDIKLPTSFSLVMPFETKLDDDEWKPVSNSQLPLTVVTRILNGIPQNLNFYKLRNYSELTRNSLISAWDHIFEQTVSEIHSLQVMDFWDSSISLWKTIEELQSVGYNVIVLRKRIVELADVMMELKLSKSKIKCLKIKAENHRMEKCRLESVIVNLQAMAKREEDTMERKMIEAADLESDLPKFDAVFAKLAIESLN